MALQIVALVLIGALLLFPATRMLRFLRREKDNAGPTLKEGPGQMIEQILILVLLLVGLTVAVLMHFAPF